MRIGYAMGVALALAAGMTAAQAQDGKVAVVAAENVYGDVAQQIGDAQVAVTSLISNPAQDPHLFEVSPATARTLSAARIVIANGADYDAWMDKLIAAAPRTGRDVIVVADLIGRKPGDNPHLWYDPAAMPAVGKALVAALDKADPAHKADYDARLAAFAKSLAPINAKIAAMRAQYKGMPVTATEPVFGLLTDAIGLENRNMPFQLAMMNDTEPSAKDVAAFESDLKQHKVKVLIYNSQVSEPGTERLRDIAKANGIPIVGVTETLPAGKHYQDWVLGELDALDKALGGAH